MNERLQERLKSLQGIRPDAAFLLRSRTNLMSAISTPTSPFGLRGIRHISLETLIPTFRLAFAMGAFSLLILLRGSNAPQTSPEVVASLDTNAIQAERLAVNATDSIANAAYFNGVSPAISIALVDIADTSTNWGSETQVKQALAVLYKNN